MLNHNVVLGSAFHCCFHFAVQSGVIDRLFFFCLHRRLETGAECCWVLLCVWAPETNSNIPAILLMDIGTPGRQRRRNLSASTLQQKSWEGEWEPALSYLQWEDLDIKLCFFFSFVILQRQPEQHPTSWFQAAVSPLIAQPPNWSHWHKRFLFSFTSCMKKKKKRSVDVCVHETRSERPLL